MNEGIVKPADKFTQNEINKFKKIVIEAGEVASDSFDGLILKNPILCFYPDTNNTKAVCALKIPNQDYKNRIFKEAGHPDEAKNYIYELGWIVCLEQFRGQGYGKKITKFMTEQDLNIYATVRTTNMVMISILRQLNFATLGNLFASIRGNYKLCLLIKTAQN